ncbi:MAG: Rieske 2Fe-2S domain-containing protein [Polyangiales bacterium]
MFPQGTHWYVACLSRQLKSEPLARVMLSQPFVLYRDAEGIAHALADRCPHRHAPLSGGRVIGGMIECPYHGWRFDGEGRCQAIPGSDRPTDKPNRRVPSLPIREQDGLVWISLRSNHADAEGEGALHSVDSLLGQAGPEHFPRLHDARYTSFLGDDILEGSLFDVVENFLDPTHTHFVHNRLVRFESKRRKTRVDITATRDGVSADYVDEDAQSGLIARVLGRDIDRTRGRFKLPSAADLDYLQGEHVKLQIALRFTPIDERQVRAFAIVMGEAPRFVGPLKPLLALIVRRLFGVVFGQDRRILHQRQANVDRHSDTPAYAFSDIDLLGPYILRLLRHGTQENVPAPRRVDVWL